MKKLFLGAIALTIAGAFAPATASARTVERVIIKEHHPHCRIMRTKVRHHGHWVVTTRKVCH